MEFKLCKRCVMDGTDPDLKLDDNGICNHCHIAFKELQAAKMYQPMLPDMIAQIKADGQTKDYDCLIGLSGGVDSSTTLHYAVEMGLRPLCFSVDNGWNDPRADENIMRLVEGLKVPFYRYTIDTHKFQKLQAAFMKAGLINLEIPTDHILMATTFEMANKYKIKWVLSGGNVATESIMPAFWSYNARDLTHIQGVYKAITGKKLEGLPTCSLLKWNYYRWVKGIKIFYLLDYLDYNRSEAIKLLEDKYGYKNYGEKHCESTFTWWFQNFYLFEKFGIDKRKAHYSAMINSGQMTRDEALELLKAVPEFPNLGIEAKVLKYPKRKHEEFPMDKWYDRVAKIIKFIRL